MWLLYIDKMFWHSCLFPLFFKCTKKDPVNCLLKATFLFLFLFFNFNFFYPIHFVELCGIVVLVLFIQPDFSPLLWWSSLVL